MITLTKNFETSWGEIVYSIRGKSKAPIKLEVGDIISMILKDGTPIRIAVAGINTYNENEVVFAFKDILPAEMPMNKENTNEGGYDASGMARHLDQDIFQLLPDDLQAIIKERRGHKLWLFSIREVFGEDLRYDCPADDVHLPYYRDGANRVKTRNGKPDWWWISTTSNADSTNFCVVNGHGNFGHWNASIFNGVAPGFCI